MFLCPVKGFILTEKKSPSTLFSLDICVWSVKAWPSQYRRAALVKAVPVQLEPSLLPMPGKAEEVYWGSLLSALLSSGCARGGNAE